MSWSHKVSSIQPRSANVVSGQDRVPQLDVLRGVAILLVLMFHPPVRYSSSSEAPWIASAFFHIGWTGVNLFFVLSGFLVGGMLLAEADNCGQLDVRRFLIRRAFKIWPSYYALLGITGIQVVRSGFNIRDLWPCLVHVQNYNPSALALLPHSWSLAVEEHFYLLLPLTLAAFPHRHRRACLAVAWAILAVVCAVARAVDRPAFPTSPTHHNLDALAWGVVLACIVSTPSAKRRIARPAPLIASGLGLLALSFFPDCSGEWWASALVPIGLYLGYGQLLLGVLGLPGDCFCGRLAQATATVGFYSYAIYLWHLTMPLPVSRWLDVMADTYGMSAWARWSLITPIYIILAIAVGVLTSRTIEQPFLILRDRLFPRRPVAHKLSLNAATRLGPLDLR